MAHDQFLPDDTSVIFDIRKLIKDLGGPGRIQTLAFAQGLRIPPLRTLHYWQRKNWASCEGAATLLVLAKRLTPLVNPWDYILVEHGEDGFQAVSDLEHTKW